MVADELRTVLWPIPPDGDDASWELRRQTWADDRAMLGGSDAGAHLDRMCGAPFPTRFLGDTLRGRKLVPLERAVQLMTQVPAELFGLSDRGTLAEGFHADIAIVDPETVGSELAELVHDLPGDSPRLTADSIGVVAGAGQRHGRRGRRQAHRRAARHRPAQRPRHRHRRHQLTGRPGPRPMAADGRLARRSPGWTRTPTRRSGTRWGPATGSTPTRRSASP